MIRHINRERGATINIRNWYGQKDVSEDMKFGWEEKDRCLPRA